MSIHELESLARKHWKQWLPQKVARLRAENRFEEALRWAAVQAQEEISQLMAAGYREHEAREVALPNFILLKPEPEADGPDEEDRAREAAYRSETLHVEAAVQLYDLKESFREQHDREPTAQELLDLKRKAMEQARAEMLDRMTG